MCIFVLGWWEACGSSGLTVVGSLVGLGLVAVDLGFLIFMILVCVFVVGCYIVVGCFDFVV